MAVKEDIRNEAAVSAKSWETDPVLSVEHLTMRFGGLVAIDDLCFDVGRGEITALIGPNGAGKTTVFNCVTGFYKPTEGRIIMRHGKGRHDDLVETVTSSGEQYHNTGDGAIFLLERMPDFQISHRARVARTFQNIRLFGGMTVLENLLVAQHNPLMLASDFTIGGLLGLPGFRQSEREAIEKATYWLERVQLIDRADDPAADLPYGAQRRLEIARCMCTGPQLLCLDEPAAGLNPRETSELNVLLQYIRTEHDTSVLLIEHDMGVVMEISDHIIVLDYGVKISDGDSSFVRNDPNVIAAYLGVDDEAEIDMEEIRAEMHGQPVAKKAPETAKKSKATAAKPAGTARGAKKSAAPAERSAAEKGRPPGMKKPAAPDDLKRISGVGPKIEGILNELGVYTFDQISRWTKTERQWVDEHLKFKGRIERDDWIAQARALGREAKKAAQANKGQGGAAAGKAKGRRA